jgi:hypothetical protein
MTAPAHDTGTGLAHVVRATGLAHVVREIMEEQSWPSR